MGTRTASTIIVCIILGMVLASLQSWAMCPSPEESFGISNIIGGAKNAANTVADVGKSSYEVAKTNFDAMPSNCIYQPRSWNGSAWTCPNGFMDTGANWDTGGDLGAKQCAHCPDPKCQYTLRVLNNGTWSCPAGTWDTGISWESGEDTGRKQCEYCP